MEWNISLWRFLDAVIQTLKNINARAVMKNTQQRIRAEYTYRYWAVSKGPMYALMLISLTKNTPVIVLHYYNFIYSVFY